MSFLNSSLLRPLTGDETIYGRNYQVKFRKTDPKAIEPFRGTAYSVGYDLTAISVFKTISEKTTLYDTGIQINPPPGYYFEIVARSSLIKTGYILTNSVGIIDPDYRGNLMIALTKVDDTAPDLELPFTRCQLIPRKMDHVVFTEVESLDDTERGEGGFGSTDARQALSPISSDR